MDELEAKTVGYIYLLKIKVKQMEIVWNLVIRKDFLVVLPTEIIDNIDYVYVVYNIYFEIIFIKPHLFNHICISLRTRIHFLSI